jgi:hypothetical protein
VPLRVLYNQYASVVQPIVGFIDDIRAEHPDDQIVVLIPVIRQEKLRYRILHNQMDVVLSSALRDRSDIVVARVTVPLAPEEPAPQDAAVETPPPAPASS